MSGEVVKVGDEVTKWNEGDKIMATFTLGLERGASCSPPSFARAPRADTGPAETGQVDDPALFASMLGGGCDGTLTQYRLFKATDLVAMPSNLTFEEASTLPCAPTTVYNALFGGPQPIKPGATVVLQGTGGVSVMGAQLVVAAGGTAIMTSSSDDKLERVRKHIHDSHNHGGAGRLHTVNYKTTPDWDKEVLKLTKNGRGADKVVEVRPSLLLYLLLDALLRLRADPFSSCSFADRRRRNAREEPECAASGRRDRRVRLLPLVLLAKAVELTLRLTLAPLSLAASATSPAAVRPTSLASSSSRAPSCAASSSARGVTSRS